jgi:beta-glucosidase
VGNALAQVYVAPATPEAGKDWEAPQRLGGFARATLAPGQSATVDIDVDPRTLATYDLVAKRWIIAAGDYEVRLASSAQAVIATTRVRLERRTL